MPVGYELLLHEWVAGQFRQIKDRLLRGSGDELSGISMVLAANQTYNWELAKLKHGKSQAGSGRSHVAAPLV